MLECASVPAVTTAAIPACRCSQGVCKLEGGFVVFCERALPGERVRARATNVRSRHALAVKLATLRPSPDEVSHLRAGWPTFFSRFLFGLFVSWQCRLVSHALTVALTCRAPVGRNTQVSLLVGLFAP